MVQHFLDALPLSVTGMANTNLCSVTSPVACVGVLIAMDKRSPVPEEMERDSVLQQVSCS